MNKFVSALLAAIALLSAPSKSSAIVGYANIAFAPGNNLFVDPFQDQFSANLLTSIIPSAPAGTTVSLWNSALNTWGATSIFDGASWSLDFSIPCGTGAQLNTPSLFTNTFVGGVLDLNGAPLVSPDNGLHLPPPFAGPNGLYLWGAKTPIEFPSDLALFFPAVVGRNPQNGEQVVTLDRLTQTYLTDTYLNGAWDNGEPVVQVGEAAFFNIGPVPEPSSIGLVVAFAGVFLARRRMRRFQVG